MACQGKTRMQRRFHRGLQHARYHIVKSKSVNDPRKLVGERHPARQIRETGWKLELQQDGQAECYWSFQVFGRFLFLNGFVDPGEEIVESGFFLQEASRAQLFLA